LKIDRIKFQVGLYTATNRNRRSMLVQEKKKRELPQPRFAVRLAFNLRHLELQKKPSTMLVV